MHNTEWIVATASLNLFSHVVPTAEVETEEQHENVNSAWLQCSQFDLENGDSVSIRSVG
jgi:hypothetical protein